VSEKKSNEWISRIGGCLLMFCLANCFSHDCLLCRGMCGSLKGGALYMTAHANGIG
jgi:hypothetical protein